MGLCPNATIKCLQGQVITYLYISSDQLSVEELFTVTALAKRYHLPNLMASLVEVARVFPLTMETLEWQGALCAVCPLWQQWHPPHLSWTSYTRAL